MAFLSRLLNRGAGRAPPEQGSTQDVGPISLPAPPPSDEMAHLLGQYAVQTVKLNPQAQDPDQGAPEVPGAGSASPGSSGATYLDPLSLAGLTEDSLVETAGAEPVGAEAAGVEAPGSIEHHLLGVFEEEVQVDEQLSALSSNVEEVAAQELVDDLRALMGQLGRGS